MSAVDGFGASLPPLAAGSRRKTPAVASIAEWSVALVALAIAAVTVGRGYDVAILATTLAAAPLVVWIVAQDVASYTIADGAVVALAALALSARLAIGDPALLLALDVLLSGGVLLAFREIYYRRRGVDGLGLGDVKLAAAGGLLVGASAFAWTLLAASAIALAGVGLVHLATRGRSDIAPRQLAFGAVLAPALYVAWLVQALPLLQGG